MTPNQKRRLEAAFDVLTLLCDDVSDTMPVRQALAFVAVALRSSTGETADLRDIAKDIKANSAVVSRDLLALGKRLRNGDPGHDLVFVREDYSDLRRKPYLLTPKGKTIISKIAEALT